MKTKLIFFTLLSLPFLSFGQEEPAPLTAEERKEVIDSISTILDRSYVFPDIGKQIAEHLRSREGTGAYAAIDSPVELAQILTEDVRAINNDLHLRVGFNPRLIADWRSTESPEDSIAFVERQRRASQQNNYGFKEVKILDGNIGYLSLSDFYHVDEAAGATAEAAMNFLSNADALIIDLRQNGGGSPSMIQLISSYLFGTNPVHLNTFYYRPQDEYSQTWTLPYVPGTRRPDMDVYILTSSRTFSAAEEFSYNLRNLERATLVGEVTGGGAHPGGTQIATDRFTVWVPTGRAINPITKTNREGTGVKPHIEVPADDALMTARIKAIEKLLAEADEEAQSQYQWALDGLKAQQTEVQLDDKTMQSHAGKYGPRTVFMENGQLYYQRDGRGKYRMIPMSEDTFWFEEIDFFRLKVMKEDGEVKGLMGLYNNGATDQNKRDETDGIKP
ncbi:MAG: S41 family peptidase [Mameliella sp.]|nr:S41 family peptidase [Phaeodactylibacter sp.]